MANTTLEIILQATTADADKKLDKSKGKVKDLAIEAAKAGEKSRRGMAEGFESFTRGVTASAEGLKGAFAKGPVFLGLGLAGAAIGLVLKQVKEYADTLNMLNERQQEVTRSARAFFDAINSRGQSGQGERIGAINRLAELDRFRDSQWIQDGMFSSLRRIDRMGNADVEKNISKTVDDLKNSTAQTRKAATELKRIEDELASQRQNRDDDVKFRTERNMFGLTQYDLSKPGDKATIDQRMANTLQRIGQLQKEQQAASKALADAKEREVAKAKELEALEAKRQANRQGELDSIDHDKDRAFQRDLRRLNNVNDVQARLTKERAKLDELKDRGDFTSKNFQQQQAIVDSLEDRERELRNHVPPPISGMTRGNGETLSAIAQVMNRERHNVSDKVEKTNQLLQKTNQLLTNGQKNAVVLKKGSL